MFDKGSKGGVCFALEMKKKKKKKEGGGARVQFSRIDSKCVMAMHLERKTGGLVRMQVGGCAFVLCDC